MLKETGLQTKRFSEIPNHGIGKIQKRVMGIGGGAGAILTDGSAAGTLGGAAVGGIIGRLITPNDDGRGNDYYNGNGADNGPRYSSRSRQSNGFGYGGYNSGDRYHSTSNEWLGN
jgi:osmotically inducible lipoprotein OsmB